MTLAEGALELAELENIGELLMGAAYADGTLEGTEMKEVVLILSALLDCEPDAVPEPVLEKLLSFKYDDFDLEAACSKLELPEAQDRRSLLALLSKISDADDIHDLDEGDYIRRVAKHIGASPEECKGLAVEVVQVRELDVPPPTPEDA